MPAAPARVLILLENASIPYDRRVTEEARALTANGYKVTIISPAAEGQPMTETLDGILLKRYRAWTSRGGAISQAIEYLGALLKTFWLMLLLTHDPGFDVIQACNPPDLFFLLAWPFKLFGKKFLFDQHDLSPELYSALYGRDSGAIMSVLRACERASYATSDAVIASNESYRQLAMGRGKVSPDRVFVVRNGPRQGWPRRVAPVPSLKAGRRFLVVFVGVIGFQDGVDVLLRVVDTLVNRMGCTDTTFAIVGDGSAAEPLREEVRRLGLDSCVSFTGWITDEERLSAYLTTADACVCPEPSSPLNDKSTFIKVMEYMSAGKPIVAFDLAETRVSAGDAARYAPPGDVQAFADLLRRVLTEEDLRDSMLAAAKRRVPELRWETQVPALLAAYDKASASKARSGRWEGEPADQ